MTLDYDTVVIGSGAGGLTAAVAMAQAGDRVGVFEQHYLPGGWCHSFQLGGHRFSPGVHYIGELHEGGDLDTIWRGLGVSDELTFFRLNPDGYDHCFLGGQRFDYCAGRQALQARLSERFPSDAKGIAAYLELTETVRDQLTVIAESRGLLDTLMIPYRTRHLGRFGLYSLARILADRVKDPMARAILSVPCGDHGLPPSKVMYGLHAAVAGHYFRGGYYPKGGGASIARALIHGLRRAKGEIKVRSAVDRILIEGRQAVGLRLADGTEVRAKRVISNADPTVTFERLIGAEHLSRGLRKRLARTRYSISSISLFFAVDADLRKLGLDSGNYWFSEDPDAERIYTEMMDPSVLDRPEVPGLFLTATTLKDPTSFQGRYHVLEAFTFLPFEVFRPYLGEDSDERQGDYAQLKATLQAKMLRGIDKLVPGLSRHVVFAELGTPLTNAHYVAGTGGNVYGTEKTRDQVGPWGFQVKTEIDGLRLCGASTMGHGVMGATLSGLAAAASFLQCRPEALLRQQGPPIQLHAADDPSSWPATLQAQVGRAAQLAS